MFRVNILDKKFNKDNQCYALVERLSDDGSFNSWAVCVNVYFKEFNNICFADWEKAYFFSHSKENAVAFFNELSHADGYRFNEKQN